MAKVKVTVTSSTEQAYNSAMLGARTLKCSRDVSSDQKMTLRAGVMVKVTMTFRTTSLLTIDRLIILFAKGLPAHELHNAHNIHK